MCVCVCVCACVCVWCVCVCVSVCVCVRVCAGPALAARCVKNEHMQKSVSCDLQIRSYHKAPVAKDLQNFNGEQVHKYIGRTV